MHDCWHCASCSIVASHQPSGHASSRSGANVSLPDVGQRYHGALPATGPCSFTVQTLVLSAVVGDAEGAWLGPMDGEVVGSIVGATVCADGMAVGARDGLEDGDATHT